MWGWVDEFKTPPHTAVLLLVVANATIYFLCAHAASSQTIPSALLLANGALDNGALTKGDYFRLVVSGFLHVDLYHLAANLISLALIGPFLEARLRPDNFVIIYAASLLAAGFGSYYGNAAPFVSVGASGALFGLIGSLLALWVMRKAPVSPLFFLINFGLIVSFSLRAPNVDYWGHAGGFIGGLVVTFILEVTLRFDNLWLRSKFPSFMRLNLVLAGLIGAGFATRTWGWAPALGASALTFVAVVKLFDLALSRRHGLAAAVGALAALNGAAAGLIAAAAATPLAAACEKATSGAGLCAHGPILALNVAVAAIVLTLMIEAHEINRGLADKGFVAAGFVAQRQRSVGL